jgi:hypothetical protein
MSGQEAQWIQVQQKSFTRWMNSFLSRRGLKIDNVVNELEDGKILCQFLEIIGNESLGKWDKNPKMRIQFVLLIRSCHFACAFRLHFFHSKAQNVELALKYIQSKGVRLLNVGATDILDKNQKIIRSYTVLAAVLRETLC